MMTMMEEEGNRRVMIRISMRVRCLSLLGGREADLGKTCVKK